MANKVDCGDFVKAWQEDMKQTSPARKAITSLGTCASLVTGVALLVVVSLGLAGVLPTIVVAPTAMGLSAAVLLIGIGMLIKKPKDALDICKIITTILIAGSACAVTMTLGGLGLAGILSVNQICIGILVTNFWPLGLLAGVGIICCPCISLGSSFFSLASVAAATGNLPQNP